MIQQIELNNIELLIRGGKTSRVILNLIKSKRNPIQDLSNTYNLNIKIRQFPHIDKSECFNYFYLIAYSLENGYDISIEYLFEPSNYLKSIMA